MPLTLSEALSSLLSPSTVAASIAGLVLVLAVIAPVLDRYVFPEPNPGPEFVPNSGDVFHSAAEGVTQKIVKRENGLLWSEFTLHPHAAGPPPHVHLTFSERFRVERGSISMRVGGRIHQLHAGEELLVPPGVVHQPFNPNDEEALVYGASADYALPERFGIFLSQIYGFIDARPENGEFPRIALQLSRFGPAYDVWLGGPPIALQKAAFWLLGPIARVLGYRTHYSQYAPMGITAVTVEPAAQHQ